MIMHIQHAIKPGRPARAVVLVVMMLGLASTPMSAFTNAADAADVAGGVDAGLHMPILAPSEDREAWATKALIPWPCVLVGPDFVAPPAAGTVWPTVATSPDGATVYVAGIVHCAASETVRNIVGWVIMAYHAELGAQLWFAQEPYVGATLAGLDVSPDGSLVFATAGRGQYYVTVAYDATTGLESWRAWHRASSARATPFDLAVSPDGTRVFVTGEHRPIPVGSSDYEYATLAYDTATGEEHWLATYSGPAVGHDTAVAIAVSPDGARVYVTGQSPGDGSNLDYATIAYDATTGEVAWIARFDGPESSVDAAKALAVDPDGTRVYVTGSSVGSRTGDDYATVAYDASDGAELWVARYTGPGPGSARDFAASLDVAPGGGTVYVTGRSTGLGTASDYSTVAYGSADGSEKWVARYNGPGNGVDAANSVNVSPDGARVYVTGESQSVDGTKGPATLAYDAATGAEAWTERYADVLASGMWAPDQFFKPAQTMILSPDGSRLIVVSDVLDPIEERKSTILTISYNVAPGTE